MKLSQSSIKDYLTESLDGCFHRWKLRHVDHIRPPDDGKWSAMKKGILFERLVLGSSRFDDDLLIPKLKSGDPTAEEKAITVLAEQAKETIANLGIKIIETQASLNFQERTGHPDAFISLPGIKFAIMDLKYTETDPDDKYRGWGIPQEMNHTQALDYVDLYYQIHGKFVPFFYLVFGKSGWCKFIKIQLTNDAIENHRRQVEWIAHELTSQKFEPTSSYNNCALCQFSEICDKKIRIPNIEIIQL